ncbi:MAG: hypothetical protein MUC48_25795 [Leptolyngbya sp. Prado105]|jgi:cell fate (sporulation/competence/biofilm development) regulator YlbF (YheA/YmcA/DUF963 family)|nr:hypothetical protein [Leptolyngbya sp. Prado105]
MEEVEEIQDELEQSPEDDRVKTTAEELEAFEKVKAIISAFNNLYLRSQV